MSTDRYSFEIFSEYDGWEIVVTDNYYSPPKRAETISWEHNENEYGMGGEKHFAYILETLGYKVKCEDVY